jgi:hypothetical protein
MDDNYDILDNELTNTSLIRSLIICSENVKSLRQSSDKSKIQLNDIINLQFSQFHSNIDRLKIKCLNEINSKYIEKQFQIPLNRIEMDVQALIIDITSLLNKTEKQQLITVERIDSSLKRIDQELLKLEKYKRNTIDYLVNKQPNINDFLNENINKLEE